MARDIIECDIDDREANAGDVDDFWGVLRCVVVSPGFDMLELAGERWFSLSEEGLVGEGDKVGDPFRTRDAIPTMEFCPEKEAEAEGECRAL